MLTRSVIVKLLVFAVVGVVGVVYAAMRYAGIGSSFINPTYTVKMDLANGGGIFVNSEVDYRGIQVGKVTAMRLQPDGVQLDLTINSSSSKIPSDLKAQVADKSAVGEQYVNLVPNTDSGPYLVTGSEIPQSATSIPLPTQDLLRNVDSLAASVPIQSLQTTVDELDNAFNNTGPDLQKLLDELSRFTSAAQAQLPQTIQLLNSGGTVLDTQNKDAADIESFSGSLEQLAAQLKTSDPQIRTLINNVPLAATQLTDLLNETGPGLGSVLANLLTTANILVNRQQNLDLMFVAYPEISAATTTVVPGDGTAHLGIVLNLFDPMVCTNGYQGTPHQAGTDTSQSAVNTNAYCAEPPSTGTDVRGAQNAPYGGKTSAAPGSSSAGSSGSASSAATPGTVTGGSGVGPTSLASLLGLG
ncbi:MAG TPA: MCE family protein [Pseudonocardiaceae bacterium]|jgi:phospholipid/cholesterol/gamma-HCH transport system substrate-binding protein|nr:MCE family protein [Pseudonocardiaceae bacterium]